MLIMKYILKSSRIVLAASLASLCLITTSAQAAGAFDISAKKQKVESSSKDGIFNPNIEKKTESYCFEVSVRNTSPLNEAQLTLQYMVLVQNPDGNVVTAAKEAKPLVVPVGVPVKTKTKTFELQSLELDRRHAKDHKVESEIYGYAIRLLNSAGEPVGEKFSSDKVKAKVDWNALGSATKPTKEVKFGAGKRGKKLKRNF